MPLRFKIQVGAPPQQVFDIVSDIANHGAWANPSAGLEVKPVSGGPTQVGSTFKSSQKFAGKHTGAGLDLDPAPERLDAVAHVGETGSSRGARRVESGSVVGHGEGQLAVDLPEANDGVPRARILGDVLEGFEHAEVERRFDLHRVT